MSHSLTFIGNLVIIPVMAEQELPSNLDLGLTQYAVSRSGLEMDVSVMGAVMAGVGELQKQRFALGLSQDHINRISKVLILLEQKGSITEEERSKALEAINSANRTSLQIAPRIAELAVPIEEVASYAKDEIEMILNNEDEFDPTTFGSMTIVETAVFKMEYFNGWVGQERWLRHFMERAGRYTKIHSEFGLRKIVLSYQGLIHFPFGDWTKMSVGSIQTNWDSNYGRATVMALANLPKMKTVEKVLKIIK